jgi:hypothetical protein
VTAVDHHLFKHDALTAAGAGLHSPQVKSQLLASRGRSARISFGAIHHSTNSASVPTGSARNTYGRCNGASLLDGVQMITVGAFLADLQLLAQNPQVRP